MAIVNKTFRIFVSSTFSDLREERNALQKDVFPRLRKLCMQHGFRFQAIDLRWGVREESALDQQTMNICLDEVARCKRPPNPNFIVLLGDRYGWQPLPAEIPAEEFEKLEKHVSGENDRSLLRRWYKRDDNAVPAVYCIQPREVTVQAQAPDSEKKKARDEESMCWRNTEADLLRILRDALHHVSLTERQKAKYESSATEQEIEAGALSVGDAGEHVYCFFREIKGLPQDESAGDFTDLKSVDGKKVPDTKAKGKLDDLKIKLDEKLGHSNIFRYGAEWTGSGITTDHIQKLCEDVYESLSRIINNEIRLLEDRSPLQKEIDAHERFLKDRAEHFIGRKEILNKIQEYIGGTDQHPIAIYGTSGSGKSALMAKAIEQVRYLHQEANVIFRFNGATPESSELRSLLKSLCVQISDIFDFEQQKNERLARIGGDDDRSEQMREKIISEYSIPEDVERLSDTFHNFLVRIPERRNLIILIDSLDQLSDTSGTVNIKWIPTDLPENVRMIVSTLPDERKNIFERVLPPNSLLELNPMPVNEGEQLLDLWLNTAKRTLQQTQRKEVLEKFSQNKMPLWLKLAFEDARKWKSYAQHKELRTDTIGIIQDLFERLSLDENHGKIIVSRSLGFLAAAKNGLTEDEMIDVLSQDEDVFNDFINRSFHEPPEQRLPFVIWSRLYFDLEPYLIEKSADGTTLLTFYHSQFIKSATSLYLQDGNEKKRHKLLADYFGRQALQNKGIQEAYPNLRKLSELPFQQINGREWNNLYETLTSTAFLEQKNISMSVYDTLEDYRQAMISMPSEGEAGELLSVLQDYFKTLDQASFVLKDHPELTFPQLYNRITWLVRKDSLTMKKIENERRAFKMPWLRLITNPPVNSELTRTFVGHNGTIKSCAFSRDGKQAVTGSADETLRLWDIETGTEKAKFIGHTSEVRACDISPDGKYVISGGMDRILKLWDAKTGLEIASLRGHGHFINACAFSPDGTCFISAGEDMDVLLWDLETKKKIFTFTGHIKPSTACSFSPDGKYFVSASGGGNNNLIIWDLKTRKERVVFKGHPSGVRDCKFNTDGNQIISCGWDRSIRIWDSDSGEQLCIINHTRPVSVCSFGSDEKQIIAAGDDNTLKIWDSESKQLISTLSGHTEKVNTFSISPDKSFILSGGNDNSLILWNNLTGGEQVSQNYHTDKVSACSFSHDGHRIISASKDKTLKIWDASKGKVLSTLEGHGSTVNYCAFSPDDKNILSCSWDKTLRTWNPETGENTNTFVGHNDDITACSYSPDGLRIVSGSNDNVLKIWDAQTGEELSTLIGHTKGINACKFSPDGRMITSCSDDKTLRLWKSESFGNVLSYQQNCSLDICAFHPAGKIIAVAHNDLTITVCEMMSGEIISTLKGHQSRLTACEFSPDGKQIVSASDDKTLKIWNAVTGEELITFRGHADRVRACAFSPDGQRVFSGDNKTLLLWDVRNGRELYSFKGQSYLITACNFSPDGTLIATCAGDIIILWNTKTGIEHATLKGHAGRVNSISFSPDNRHLVSASLDKTLILWDVEKLKKVAILHGHNGSVIEGVFSPDGKQILSASHDKTLKLWDALSGLEMASLPGHTQRLTSCRINQDGTQIYSAGSDNTVKKWDITGWENTPYLIGHTKMVSTCRFSPDGNLILSASGDHLLKLWNARTGEELMTLKGHHNKITAANFSPDGRRIISGSMDNTLKLWETKTGELVKTLEGHSGAINSCSVSPDNQHIISSSRDKSLRIWNTKTGDAITSLIGHTNYVNTCQFSPDGKNIVIGDDDGQVLLLSIENLKPSTPVVTPVRYLVFGRGQVKVRWDDSIKSSCKICGNSFVVPEKIQNIIMQMNRDLDLSDNRSCYSELPDETWNDQNLIADCPRCNSPLRFNPFIVDTSRETEPFHFQKPSEQKIREKRYSDANDRFTIGWAWWNVKEVNNAIHEYREAIRIDSNHLAAHYNLGVAYWEKGMIEEAIYEWEMVLKIQNDHADAHHNLGLGYKKLGIYDKAESHFQRATDLGHKKSEGQTILLENEEKKEKSRLFNPFTETQPVSKRGNAIKLNNLGVKSLKKELKDQAVTYFKRSIQEDPDFALPHINLGATYINRNRIQEAISEYNEAIRLEPDNADAHNYLGIAFTQAKLLKKAIYHFERASELGHKTAKSNLEKASKMLQESKGGFKSFFKRRSK